MTNYFLLKTEGDCFSIEDQKKEKVTVWDGVRNYTARNHMKTMKIGDICLFYHSGKERAVVGLVKVVKKYYPDSLEPNFGNVDVEFLKEFKKAVSLKEIKEDVMLENLPMIKQGRLSVFPVTELEFKIICEKGQTELSNN